MISINKQGNAIVIEFTDNDKYLFNGTIEVAPNELMVVIDESNMATFKRSNNGDTLFSQLTNKIQIGGINVTKDTILDEFAKIGFTTGSGGSGGAVNSVNGQTGDVIITASNVGAITKADADTLYAAKSDLNSKADISDVPTNTQFNNLAGEVANKADKTSVYTKTEADEKFATNIELNQVLSEYATNVELNHVKAELANKADTSSLNGKVDKVEGKSLISDSEITRLATVTNYDDTEVKNLIATKANSADVYTKTESDAKYLTEHQSLANYATKSEIPTATSQLTNDSGYITSIPSEYITETELSSSLSTKADSANVYTKAEIDNMIGDISARLDQINGEVI